MPPDVILVLIAEHLATTRLESKTEAETAIATATLYNLSLTSRRVRIHVEPVLYRHISCPRILEPRRRNAAGYGRRLERSFAAGDPKRFKHTLALEIFIDFKATKWPDDILATCDCITDLIVRLMNGGWSTLPLSSKAAAVLSLVSSLDIHIHHALPSERQNAIEAVLSHCRRLDKLHLHNLPDYNGQHGGSLAGALMYVKHLSLTVEKGISLRHTLRMIDTATIEKLSLLFSLGTRNALVPRLDHVMNDRLWSSLRVVLLQGSDITEELAYEMGKWLQSMPQLSTLAICDDSDRLDGWSDWRSFYWRIPATVKILELIRPGSRLLALLDTLRQTHTWPKGIEVIRFPSHNGTDFPINSASDPIMRKEWLQAGTARSVASFLASRNVKIEPPDYFERLEQSMQRCQL